LITVQRKNECPADTNTPYIKPSISSTPPVRNTVRLLELPWYSCFFYLLGSSLVHLGIDSRVHVNRWSMDRRCRFPSFRESSTFSTSAACSGSTRAKRSGLSNKALECDSRVSFTQLLGFQYQGFGSAGTFNSGPIEPRYSQALPRYNRLWLYVKSLL
jgi:hypothetical protein